MRKSVIKIENLVKRYKDLIAIDHFSIDIKEGEIGRASCRERV